MSEWSPILERLVWKYVVSATVGFCIGAVITFTLIRGPARSLEIPWIGLEINVPGLSTFLREQLSSNRAQTEAILGMHGYFKPSSNALLDRLHHMDLTQDDGKKVASRLRQMLANLEGPFQLPGTLQEADEKFMKALEQLDQTAVATKKANALLAKLWEKSLERRGVFRQRRFPATVELVEKAPTGKARIFACPDGALSQGWSVDIFAEHHIRALGGPVESDPMVFDCEKAIQTRELLTETAKVRFGLNDAAYRRLYPEGRQGPPSAPRDVRFMVYKGYLVPAVNSGGKQ